MLTSILPVVHGDSQWQVRRTWVGLAAVHSLATVTAAAAVGAILAVVTSAVRGPETAVSPLACWCGALLSLVYTPRQFGWIHFPPLLQSRRQVPREWAYQYPRWASALLFGLGLGNGCYTRIVTPTFYLLFIWPFLMPGLLGSVAIWGCYGLARTVTVWWLACTAPVGDPFPSASKTIAALLRRGPQMRWANALLLLLVAAWLVAGSCF
jgi:hypothetical protein